MAQFRRPERYENPFAQIPNKTLEDPDISWKAKGIMSYLLSKSDDWEIYQEQLSNVGTDGRTATRSGVEELREHGYLERRELRDDEGKFEGYEYVIRPFGGEPPDFSSPDSKSPDSRKSNIGSADVGEPATTNKESTNKENTNTDTTSNDVDADASESQFLQLCAEDSTQGDQVPEDEIEVTSNTLAVSSTGEEEVPREEIMDLVHAVDDSDDLGSMGWRLGVLFRRLFAPWWDDDKLRENLSRLIREAKRLVGEQAPDGSVIHKERAYLECAKALVYLYQERDDLHGRSDPGAQKDQPVAALNVLSRHISLEFEGTDEKNEAELSEIEKAVRNA